MMPWLQLSLWASSIITQLYNIIIFLFESYNTSMDADAKCMQYWYPTCFDQETKPSCASIKKWNPCSLGPINKTTAKLRENIQKRHHCCCYLRSWRKQCLQCGESAGHVVSSLSFSCDMFSLIDRSFPSCRRRRFQALLLLFELLLYLLQELLRIMIPTTTTKKQKSDTQIDSIKKTASQGTGTGNDWKIPVTAHTDRQTNKQCWFNI